MDHLPLPIDCHQRFNKITGQVEIVIGRFKADPASCQASFTSRLPISCCLRCAQKLESLPRPSALRTRRTADPRTRLYLGLFV